MLYGSPKMKPSGYTPPAPPPLPEPEHHHEAPLPEATFQASESKHAEEAYRRRAEDDQVRALYRHIDDQADARFQLEQKHWDDRRLQLAEERAKDYAEIDAIMGRCTSALTSKVPRRRSVAEEEIAFAHQKAEAHARAAKNKEIEQIFHQTEAV